MPINIQPILKRADPTGIIFPSIAACIFLFTSLIYSHALADARNKNLENIISQIDNLILNWNFSEAEKLAPLIENNLTVLKAYNKKMLGNFYFLMGKSKSSLKEYETSRRWLNLALDIYHTGGRNYVDEYLKTLHEVGITYSLQNNFLSAKDINENSVDLFIKTFGINDARLPPKLMMLSYDYSIVGMYDKAILSLKDAIKYLKYGKNSWKFLSKLYRLLSINYFEVAEKAKGIQYLELAIELIENNSEPSDQELAISLGEISTQFLRIGMYQNAMLLNEKILAFYSRTRPFDHPDTLQAIKSLAFSAGLSGDSKKEIMLLGKVLTIERQQTESFKQRLFSLSYDLPIVSTLLDMTMAYISAGNIEKAATLLLEAKKTHENHASPGRSMSERYLSTLASIQRIRGLKKEEEITLSKILDQHGEDNVFGRGSALVNLAFLKLKQNKIVDAKVLLYSALDIYEKQIGKFSPLVNNTLEIIAALFIDIGYYETASRLYERILKIYEVRGQAPKRSTKLGLGKSYLYEKRFSEALQIFRGLLAFGNKNTDTVEENISENRYFLGLAYSGLKKYMKASSSFSQCAEPFFNSGQLIQRRQCSIGNALSLHFLNKNKEAIRILNRPISPKDNITDVHFRKLSTAPIIRALIQTKLNYLNFSAFKDALFAWSIMLGGEYSRRPPILFQVNSIDSQSVLIDMLFAMSKNGIGNTAEIADMAFVISQEGRKSSTEQAIIRMSRRFLKEDSNISKLIRKKQDLNKEFEKLDRELIKRLLEGGNGKYGDLYDGIEKFKEVKLDLDGISQTLIEKHPKFALTFETLGITIKEVQTLIHKNEAILRYFSTKNTTYLFFVSQRHSRFIDLKLTRMQIHNLVFKVRKSLNTKNVSKLSQVPPFDVRSANLLYQSLILPAAQMLKDIRHLILVKSDALDSIPFSILVENSNSFKSCNGARCRKVDWLVQKFSTSSLPTIKSLKALRLFASVSTGEEPFRGYGDPKLDGNVDGQDSIDPAKLYSRGELVDATELRKLPPLPDTAVELIAIARILGADSSSLFLAGNATETQVKKANLSDTRILSFATHGLISGELKGVQEPGLVLTPPKVPTTYDDGFLKASEIAQLKLNADLVILSACNTASTDGTPGAEGLSGLAKAFFYAGSRSLLVSHWPVLSRAAMTLTIGMLEKIKRSELGKAAALRQSMLNLMNNPKNDYLAHPLFWGPFSVVGEGL